MRTVIYARRSTDTEDKQVHSLEDQLKAMKELATRHGLTVVGTFYESESAKAPGTRPEFEKMIRKIRNGEAEAILTWAVNRLSRNPVDGGQLAYLLQMGKLKLVQTYDRAYTPDDSSLLFAIENAMATDFVRNLKKDVARGMRERAERGWAVCKAPLGYLNDADTREIVADPVRYPIVRRAWDLMLQGDHSIGEVHRAVLALGLTTSRKRGSSPPVSLSRLYSMFREPFYAGVLRYDGDTYDGRHQPVVSKEEFETVQEILDGKYRRKSPARLRLPFAGAMKCGVCGNAIVGEIRKKRFARDGRIVEYVYYHCSGRKGCSKRGVRGEELAQAVAERLQSVTVTKGTAEWLKRAFMESLERDACETAQDRASLAREAARMESRLRKLTVMRVDGEITAAEHSEARAHIQAELDNVHESIRRAEDSAGRLTRTVGERIDAAVKMGELGPERRDPKALAVALRIGGAHVLNVSPFEFKLDPVIEKIAMFEPLGEGSERDKHGDRLRSNSVWWALLQDVRNLVTEEYCCADEREKEWRRRYGRYSWRPEKNGDLS